MPGARLCDFAGPARRFRIPCVSSRIAGRRCSYGDVLVAPGQRQGSEDVYRTNCPNSV